MTQLGTDDKQECRKLLGLLAQVIGANKGSTIGDDDRYLYAEGLANKCFKHTLTALVVSRGMNIADFPSKEIGVIDVGSVDVLTRAALETFLTFHYIFSAPKTKEEQDYRFWAYKAAGIAERQNLPEKTAEQRQQKAKWKKKLEELHDKLKSNAIFQSLDKNQKEQIFEGKGKWRWKPSCKKHLSWREIAIDAGFSKKMLASHMYRYLSGYAHSSSLSILQINQAYENRQEERLVSSAIATINILTANLVREYCELFPKGEAVLSKDLEGKNLVEQWIQIGQRLDEDLDVGQEND
jgi:hypothetical protein